MSELAQNMLRDALRLPPNDRAAPAEQLSASLDKPAPLMDALWLEEAESRMAATVLENWMPLTLKRCLPTWAVMLEGQAPASCAAGIGAGGPPSMAVISMVVRSVGSPRKV